MIELIIILFIVAIFSGLGKWATEQRFQRKYEEKYKDCCGTNCCEEKNESKK